MKTVKKLYSKVNLDEQFVVYSLYSLPVEERKWKVERKGRESILSFPRSFLGEIRIHQASKKKFHSNSKLAKTHLRHFFPLLKVIFNNPL